MGISFLAGCELSLVVTGVIFFTVAWLVVGTEELFRPAALAKKALDVSQTGSFENETK